MTAKEYTELLSDPSLLQGYSMPELLSLSRQYPFMPSIYALIAKKAHTTNDNDYESHLHKAALHIPNRKVLYQLIHGSDITEVEEIPATKQIDMPPQTVESTQPVPEAKAEPKPEETQEVEEKKTKEPTTDKPTYEVKKENLAEKPKPAQKRKTSKKKRKAKPKKEATLKIEKKAAKDKIPEKEQHSFTEWFSHLQKKTTEPKVPTDHSSAYEAELIQQAEKETTPKQPESKVYEDMSKKELEDTISHSAKESLEMKKEMVTETLAKIYFIQGKYDKAIETYEALILKYPDKKAYFAEKIDSLKKH